jgi:hypothetical protein
MDHVTKTSCGNFLMTSEHPEPSSHCSTTSPHLVPFDGDDLFVVCLAPEFGAGRPEAKVRNSRIYEIYVNNIGLGQ